ncbi:MAG TPA: efflux RND transporter periplasmic adaptor subunit [Acidobacteriota bacterium]
MSKPGKRWIIAVLIAAVLGVVVIVWLLHAGKDGGEGETTADMAVHAGRITRTTMHRFVNAFGTVQPEPAGPHGQPAAAAVAAPVTGIISRVDCSEGQRVDKGTVLFHLDGRVAGIGREKARQALAYAEENFERQKKLLAVEGTSRKNYLEAEQQLNAARSELLAATTGLALLEVVAPLAGIVVKVNVAPGEAVEANTVLARIIDPKRLVGMVDVPVREATLVKVGQPVQCAECGGRGAVAYIGSQVDGGTDTLPVRITLPASGDFHSGQFLQVSIVCEVHADCLAVPEAAVVSDTVGGASGTIVLVEGDRALPKPVRIGLREAGLVEVEGPGLREGQVIVAEDAYAIPGEVKIHIVK